LAVLAMELALEGRAHTRDDVAQVSTLLGGSKGSQRDGDLGASPVSRSSRR
jgi:hypothetical protein